MGTRSTIAIRNDNGTVTSIYCHWDGYLSHNGNILYQFYRDVAKVRELMALGNISSLGREIGTQHAFDTRPEGETTAYGRDRGEDNQEAKLYGSWNELIDNDGEEYNYIFEPKDNAWYVEYSGRVGKVIEEMSNETA